MAPCFSPPPPFLLFQESGTHEELVDQQGLYYKMVQQGENDGGEPAPAALEAGEDSKAAPETAELASSSSKSGKSVKEASSSLVETTTKSDKLDTIGVDEHEVCGAGAAPAGAAFALFVLQ